MDAVFGLGNFVKDILDAETDLSKFAEKLKLALYRFSRVYEEMLIILADEIQVTMYKKLLDEGKGLFRETEERLSNMGLAGKISMSLPFDKTKANLRTCIEELEKATAELKEKQLKLGMKPKMSKIDEEEDNKEGFLPSRTNSKIQKSSVRRLGDKKDGERGRESDDEEVVFNPTLVAEQDSPVMMPTLVEREEQGTDWLEITVDLVGSKSMLDVIKGKGPNNPLLTSLRNFSRFQINKKMQPKQIMGFNRKFFKPVYDKVIQKHKQIDFISSKANHFQLFFIYVPPQQEQKKKPQKEPRIEDILISTAKQSLGCFQKPSLSQQFFSFPPDRSFAEFNQYVLPDYKLMLRNKADRGTYLKHYGQSQKEDWQFITQEIEVRNGDLICPIMKFPEKKEPVVVFKVVIEKILL